VGVSPDLEQIRSGAEKLVSGIAVPEWHRAPAGKWNCAQILEHLLLSYTATTKGALQAMETGRPLGSKPRLRERIGTFYVVNLGRLPSGRSSPPQAMPKNGLKTESLREFNNALVAMDGTLFDAERRFGSHAKVLDHPILGPLTAEQWRRFHRIHTEHHFKQITELLKSR
jgi:hypothetical protein